MSQTERKVYKTRQRARKENTDLKYDDIFSSVVKKITNEAEFGGLSKRLIEENTLGVRSRLLSVNDSRTGSSSNDEDTSSGGDDSLSAPTTPRKRTISTPIPMARLPSSLTVRRKSLSVTKGSEETAEKMKESNEKKKFACQQCSEGFDRHMQLHRHLLSKHPSRYCPHCHLSPLTLRHRHECCKCGEFAVNLNEHLIKVHYAQSQRPGAPLECGRCSRTFSCVTDVMHHERRAHGMTKNGREGKRGDERKKRKAFSCRACGAGFSSRYLRDQHLTKHFQSVIESVWTTIDRMQEEHPDKVLVNQCPLCGFVMSSRKSFRTHVIHRHLMYDFAALDRLVGPNVKEEELETVRMHIASERQVPYPTVEEPIREVKEEKMDNEEKKNGEEKKEEKREDEEETVGGEGMEEEEEDEVSSEE